MSMRDTPLWTWHLIAGVVILVLLGLHMTIMHLGGVVHLAGFNPASQTAIDWTNVAYRARQVFFMVSYVVLLGAALFHGLYGLRNIFHELDPSPTVKRIGGAFILIVGIGLFLLGTWAAVAARTSALAAAL